MSESMRPTYTFILRLWREPDAPQGDAGWRGQLRALETRDAPAPAAVFADLANLAQAIRELLAVVSQTQ